MYDLIPILLVIKREAMASFVRNREDLRDDTRGLSAKSHLRKWEQLDKTWQLSKEDSDRISYNIWEKLCKVNDKSYTTETKSMRAQINIDTDGNKTDEHTECGLQLIDTALK